MMNAAFDCAPLGDLASEFDCRRVTPDRRNADAPLIGLAGSDLASRFRHWRGLSGRRYLFSVFPLRSAKDTGGCPRYREAVILAVARNEDSTRRILWAGQTGVLPDLLFDGDVLTGAFSQGANEIHMHLLANDKASRNAMIRDIAG